MKKKAIITIVFLANSLVFFGQSSINTSSKDVVSSGGSISYSVGQVFSNTTTSNGSLFSGIQLPFVSDITLGLDDRLVNAEIQAFPNPVLDNLVISLNDTSIKNLTYVVYNTLGLKVMNGEILDVKTNISFTKQLGTMYFVNILKKGKIIKTFKILKK